MKKAEDKDPRVWVQGSKKKARRMAFILRQDRREIAKAVAKNAAETRLESESLDIVVSNDLLNQNEVA